MFILQRIWYFYCAIAVSLSVVLFLPLYLALLIPKGHYENAQRTRKANAKLMLFLCGIRARIFNRENIPSDQPVIYCPNHTSYLDIILCLAVLPGNFGFIGKQELLRNPVLRLFFGKTDIPVRRESIVHSSLAFKRSEEFLKSGWSIVMFPEGGIRKTAPQLAQFKAGPFRLSVETDAPIIPVTLADNYYLFPAGEMLARPGIARVYIHKPEFPENKKGASELKTRTFEILSNYMNKVILK